MEKHFTDPAQKRTTPAPGNANATLAPIGRDPGEDFGSFSNLERLRQLISGSSSGFGEKPNLSRPITLESFEMLEAELQNQGILPPPPDSMRCAFTSLSQRAQHEKCVWLWKAKCRGVEADALRFFIDVPRYLLARGRRLVRSLSHCFPVSAQDEQSWLQRDSHLRLDYNNSQAIAGEELSYLEYFAEYLCGSFESPSNRYQRGLNVVLKALVRPHDDRLDPSPRRELEPNPEPNGKNFDPLRILLPMDRRKFLSSISEIKRRCF